MTIEERLKEMLVQRGMFGDMPDKVMERVKALEDNEEMIGRWGNSADEPDIPIAWLWMLSVKPVALAYLNEHHPRAFFRANFE